ncbi:hypothetical protein E3T55_18850 [Cryobacterium frigoriphilum]|uniref:Ribbon-helix-helix protein, CopG family n=1 Tax=Cryobacterium frigoriphilum TaxID=1259150 RepID=A0A4R8ZTZ3_9MICO|nr:ribbon-helix-helix protein, CopG family [Cryobacterium frigoriphilum]TFD45391.1 hypothetical protein E3T55_18850 [Cryobacterium frigoriphilum]
MSDPDYSDIAQRLGDPLGALPEPRNVRTGAAAAAAGRALLIGEYGSEDALTDALRPGRPRIGTSAAARGSSPTVRGRISDADFAALKELGERTGKNQSELVRESVHRLLAAEGMLPSR